MGNVLPFSTLNGYEVKDAVARQNLVELGIRVESLETNGGGGGSDAASVLSCSDCNTATTAGFYYLVIPAANAPSDFPADSTLFVEYSPNIIQQTITYGNMTAKRCFNVWTNTWNPWEYENPPMNNGVAYRTTERYKGHPVYAVTLSLGDTRSAGVISMTAQNVEVAYPDFTVIDISAVFMDAESTKEIGCYYNAIPFFDYIAVSTSNSPLTVRAKRNDLADYNGVICETVLTIKFVRADLDSAYA